MPSQRSARKTPLKIVVTNSATFSNVARAQIRSETATLIALRKNDERRQALALTAVPFPHSQPSSGCRVAQIDEPSTSRSLLSESAQPILSNSSVKKQSSQQERIDDSENRSPAIHSRRDTEIPKSIAGLLTGSSFETDPESIALLHRYQGQFLRLRPRTGSGRGPIGSAVDWVILRALQDQVLLNSVLCAATVLVPNWSRGLQIGQSSQRPEKYPPNQPIPTPPFALYKSKALQLLQQRLSADDIRKSLTETFFAIELLLISELHHGTVEGIRAHCNGLQQMIENTNVIKVAPLSVVIAVVTVLYLGAAVGQVLPAFPPIIPATIISPETWMLVTDSFDPKLPKTAAGFSGLTVTGLIGPQLMDLVKRRRLWFVVRELASNGQLKLGDSSEYMYFYSSSKRVDFEILDLMLNQTGTLTPLQICVVQALFLAGYLNGIMRFQAASMYSRILCQRYHAALALHCSGALRSWCSDAQLMVWLLFIGAHISREQDTRPWFIAHLARAVRLADIDDTTQLEEVLGTYFYFRVVYVESIKDIWKEVQEAIKSGSDA